MAAGISRLWVSKPGDVYRLGRLAAQAPGAARECQLQWEAASESFLDPCSGRRFPADGEGLTRYAAGAWREPRLPLRPPPPLPSHSRPQA